MGGDRQIELEGTVVDALSSTRFRVEVARGKQVVASLASQMRLELIRVLPGDKVLVDFSPYDLSRGRIIRKTNELQNEG